MSNFVYGSSKATPCLCCDNKAVSTPASERSKTFYACEHCGFQWFSGDGCGNVFYWSNELSWLLVEPGLLVVFNWEKA